MSVVSSSCCQTQKGCCSGRTFTNGLVAHMPFLLCSRADLQLLQPFLRYHFMERVQGNIILKVSPCATQREWLFSSFLLACGQPSFCLKVNDTDHREMVCARCLAYLIGCTTECTWPGDWMFSCCSVMFLLGSWSISTHTWCWASPPMIVEIQ